MPKLNFYLSTDLKINNIEGFHILQDHIGTWYSQPWNDHNYIVTFNMYFVKSKEKTFVGKLKILAKGQENTSEFFKNNSIKEEDSSYPINNLLKNNNIVSLGLDLDYYRKISVILKEKAEIFLKKICDASYYQNKLKDYESWDGFSSSIFRESTVAKTILRKGSQIARGQYEPKNAFSIDLKNLHDEIDPITLTFNNQRSLGNTNINLLIGKNGSGKSHVLRHVINLLTGVKPNDESWPYFHKVVVAAYSPFETFLTTNQLFSSLPQNITDNEISNNELSVNPRPLVNEYSYIGFKNENDEFSLDWPKNNSAKAIKKIFDYDRENYWWKEHSRFQLLFSTLQQAIQFDTLSLSLEDNSRLNFTKDNIIKLIKEDNEINNINYKNGISFFHLGNVVNLSSGQTIYSYLLPCLVAEIEDESLIILDEPELYLHPSMEISLLNMLKSLLSATKSNAIVATHSSIIVREVERKAITILRREGAKTETSNPSFETFGQSLEMIIGEAFDDHQTKKHYESSLDKEVKKYNSIEEALNSISDDIGDEAFSYLAAKIQDDSEIIIEDI